MRSAPEHAHSPAPFPSGESSEQAVISPSCYVTTESASVHSVRDVRAIQLDQPLNGGHAIF